MTSLLESLLPIGSIIFDSISLLAIICFVTSVIGYFVSRLCSVIITVISFTKGVKFAAMYELPIAGLFSPTNFNGLAS